MDHIVSTSGQDNVIATASMDHVISVVSDNPLMPGGSADFQSPCQRTWIVGTGRLGIMKPKY
jgi:hypothetical protein